MKNHRPIPRFVSLKSGAISSRFAKLCGRSGRSYIVTEVPASVLMAYHDCIAIAVVRERIAGVWLAGEGWQPDQALYASQQNEGFPRSHVRWFLHFLSGSDPQAVEDLRPVLPGSGLGDGIRHECQEQRAA
uniref:hypothetical protein n=1 Tax=Pararhizobium sp. IMCC3301 TaxID=3067904 RepID=UPI0027416793|nr:hypothetical protein [Pararhizobium sp. IMCC3301]